MMFVWIYEMSVNEILAPLKRFPLIRQRPPIKVYDIKSLRSASLFISLPLDSSFLHSTISFAFSPN